MANDPFDEFPNPYQAPKTQFEESLPTRSATSSFGINLAHENPWITIWTRPRATIRGIVDQNPTYRVIPLAIASGIVQVMSQFVDRDFDPSIPLLGILGLAVVIGPILGIVQLYIGGWWFSNMGKIFNGRGESMEVRVALAWSSVPNLASMPFLLSAIALLSTLMSNAELSGESARLIAAVLLAIAAIQIMLGVWSGVVFLKGLGEVHGFSAWRALACAVVPGLLLVLFVGVLVFIVMISMR